VRQVRPRMSRGAAEGRPIAGVDVPVGVDVAGRLDRGVAEQLLDGLRVAVCPSCATLCHMDVSVRELRNHTARVIAAVEGGEPVVLTVHGRPVADIVPRRVRSERRPSELLLADLTAISQLASEFDVASDAADFDVGLTTDDMVA
jgi:prevent-host-death family protein